MITLEEAKDRLDKHIKKQRVLMYKPIQIAEILYHHRSELEEIDPSDVNTYRTKSKRWRDQVTRGLVGRVCTSSAKFQDNLFDKNAIPPELITVLAEENKENDGIVESYIYNTFRKRLMLVRKVEEYLVESTVDTFSLGDFLDIFETENALKKSIDKIYEITVYSLFYTIINYLEVEVELKINNQDTELLKDFNEFTRLVIGLDHNVPSKKLDASIYRVGVTNAADKGLDMWTNFGPVVQVKHLTLTEEIAEDITDTVRADEIVIVCKKAEATIIQTVLSQIGSTVQGVITEVQLKEWFELCFNKHKEKMGQYLLESLRREFREEFPSTLAIDPFLQHRGYSIEKHGAGNWVIDANN
jgi:hypothetical protein